MLSSIVRLEHRGWTDSPSADLADVAAVALERGDLLFFPNLAFPIEPSEQSLFSPAILSSRKNARFDPSTRRVGGTTLSGEERVQLTSMMSRFSDASAALASRLLPVYRGRIVRGRSSFRPAEIAGRVSTWRKDDTRLHVDSFPATPVQDRRILRVFTNVNPSGRPRSWRVGEDFEAVAQRFNSVLSLPWLGMSSWLLKIGGVTKTRRSPYDALMLQLHDRMKADMAYQRSAPQTPVDFPAGSTWIAFTDHVSHAAMAGQYQLEQTFYLPVSAMIDPSRSPLRILERLKQRRLV